MGTPIQIGQYCSDFVIQDPDSLDGAAGKYYKRVHTATNRTFYLAIDASGDLIEIENPIPVEATPTWRTNSPGNYKLRLHWDKTVRHVVDSNSVITPQNKLRYMSSAQRPDPGNGSKIVMYEQSNRTIQLRTTGTGIGPLSPIHTFSTVASSTTVTYTETTKAPDKVESSASLVYLVDDDDDNQSIVTSTTQKMYLIINPASLPLQVRIINLFLPEVTEAMVSQTLYRINKKTDIENSATSYSFDVFREPVTGNVPTTGSTLNYREIPGFSFDQSAGSTDIQGTASSSFVGTKITLQDGGTTKKYVVYTQIFDKSVADLYGELSLGLFKIPDPYPSSLYLGYDCATPSATCSSPTLVLREYYNFLNPVNSAQFRMYDLGNREYMILVTEPTTTPPRRLMMKPNSSGALTFTNVTATKEERGWHLEKVNLEEQTVRLRWNYPSSPVPGAGASASIIEANYLQISTGTNPNPTMAVQSSATVFQCIKCSKVDEQTGTCATNAQILVDHDMDFTTSPRWTSPTPLDLAARSPAMVRKDFKLANADGNMSVSDDGVISFGGGAGDSFFTTQTGIITIEQRRRDVVFLGTTTATEQYIYAKYTAGSPPNIKFVASTNPNVSDGFGWIVDFASNRITWVSPASPAPSTPITLGITSIITTFSVSLDTYDAENDRYELVFTMVKQGVTFGSSFTLTSGTGTLTYISGNGTRLARAYITATRPSSPINCDNGSPSPNPTRAFTRSVTISASITGAPNDTVTISIPEGPCPTVTSAPSVASSLTTTSASFNGFSVSNMNSTGSVTIRLKPEGSPGSAAPAFTYTPQLTYGPGSFTLSGLSVNTRYAAPSFSFMNSISKKQVGVTLVNGFQTNAGPSVGTVTVSGTTVSYTVNNGPLPVPPTIKYKRVAAPSSTVPGGTWSPLGDGIVSTSTTSQSGGSVTVTIVPDNTQAFNYFFSVDDVAGSGFIPVPAVVSPAQAVNAAYMNGGAAGRQFYLKVGTQYAKININAANIDDTGNRFWQTTDKSQASTFTVDTSKTYSADSTYKTIRLAAYYDGTMRDYSGSTAYLRHINNWVYKSAYGANTSVDFHWKFEDDVAGGGMKIRNPLSIYNAGLYFTADTDGTVRLRTASPFTLAQTFTVEFRDYSPVVSPVGGGAGGGAVSDGYGFTRTGTVTNNSITAMQLSKDGRTGYLNFTPVLNPGGTQNCSGRVNITSNSEFNVGNALKLLDYTIGGLPVVAKVTARQDGDCYLEVDFYKVVGSSYVKDNAAVSSTSRNTTSSLIEYGTI